MEYKKESIAALEKALQAKTETYWVNEADYRTFTGMVMASSKPSADLQGAQGKTKMAKDLLLAQIRQIRTLLEELKSDKVTV